VAGYPGTTPPGHFPSKVLVIVANPVFDEEQPEHPLTNPKVLCLVHMTKQMTTEWQLEVNYFQELLSHVDSDKENIQ
jgi:hypothetical protein